MSFFPRFLLILVLVFGSVSVRGAAPDRANDLQHMREELGVNEFTAPAIGLIFEQLDALRPIPFDKAWRDLPESSPQDRARLALSAGQVIADGFLAVSSQKQSRIEPVARLLFKLSKGLGVSEHLTKHTRSLMELTLKERWAEIRQELVRAQAEVEAGMLALKDEELAHLVSLGGWIRGLEITASIVLANYSEERARTLIQPELLAYFRDRMETLNPTLKASPLMVNLSSNLAAISKLTANNAPLTLDAVKEIRARAGAMNQAIATP